MLELAGKHGQAGGIGIVWVTGHLHSAAAKRQRRLVTGLSEVKLLLHSSPTVQCSLRHLGRLVPGPRWMPKSADAQVVIESVWYLHITYAHPPEDFKSSVDYL